MKKAFYVMLILLLVSVAGNVWQYVSKERQEQQGVTLVTYDTVSYKVTTFTHDTVLWHDTVRLPVVRTNKTNADNGSQESRASDTIVVHDSVAVEIPITQRLYEGERYRAWVSGFRPSLDSIEVYSTTTTITMPKEKPKRWGVGIQAGYGAGRNGLQPYIGVGVSYNLLRF